MNIWSVRQARLQHTVVGFPRGHCCTWKSDISLCTRDTAPKWSQGLLPHFWINKTNSWGLVAMLVCSGICQCTAPWAVLGTTLDEGLQKAFWTAFPSAQGRLVLPFIALWGPGLGWACYIFCSPLGSLFNFSLPSLLSESIVWSSLLALRSTNWSCFLVLSPSLCPQSQESQAQLRVGCDWGRPVHGGEGEGGRRGWYETGQLQISLHIRRGEVLHLQPWGDQGLSPYSSTCSKDQNVWETGSRNLWVFRKRIRTSFPTCLSIQFSISKFRGALILDTVRMLFLIWMLWKMWVLSSITT